VRQPDLIIGPRDAPQTLRWHLFRWRGLQVALHRWERSDSDRALHDHSAGNVSILLTGCYREQFSHAWQPLRWKKRWPLVPYYRAADTPHRVWLTTGPLWTLWIRFKPWREWGFWCSPDRWVHWKDYVDKRDHGLVGRGCD
jgi:hypothetical protein